MIITGALTINLATKDSDGAMSKEDKKFIDSVPTTYATIERVKTTSAQTKYNISAAPEGTLVNSAVAEDSVDTTANA